MRSSYFLRVKVVDDVKSAIFAVAGNCLLSMRMRKRLVEPPHVIGQVVPVETGRVDQLCHAPQRDEGGGQRLRVEVSPAQGQMRQV